MTGAARQPFLLGTIGAVIGIVLAVVVFGGFGGGTASASASPTTGAVASAGASAAPSAIETGAPTAAASEVPPTSAPTAPPTSAPTAAPTPKPSPTPNTNPQIVTFEVPKQEDCTGSTAGSVHLKWTVKNATGVTISIDGPGIYKPYPGVTNEDDVPFGCDQTVLEHTYTLTTVGGTGPAATITKTIKTRPPSITAFAMDPVTECAGDTGQANLRFSYAVRAATGAELWFKNGSTGDFNIYGSYTGKEVGPISIPYDCQYASITYRLVTTGGYGDAASKTIKVTRP